MRLRGSFYWPGMKSAVMKLVQGCGTCQKHKPSSGCVPGYCSHFQFPTLPGPTSPWIFVEGLPKSAGKDVILVVIDRLTKYGHFIALSHPFTAEIVAKVFLDTIYKLHGPPISIISNRDKVFTSSFWKELFRLIGTQLALSSAYHPQTDGQTERLNQCLENYLRCMVSSTPKQWCKWLPLAEYWYNTNYHTSLKTTPFQALYGYPPPHLSLGSYLDTSNTKVADLLEKRQAFM